MNKNSKTPKKITEFIKENKDSLYIGKALEFLETSYILNFRDRALYNSKKRRYYMSIAKKIDKVFAKYSDPKIVEKKLEKILKDK